MFSNSEDQFNSELAQLVLDVPLQLPDLQIEDTVIGLSPMSKWEVELRGAHIS